jgi:RNA polymerase sigma-70 factor (ECF subfamily)
MNDTPGEYRPSTAFLLQLTNHQSEMYAAVAALLGGVDGAQDVLQETNAALLEKAGEYDPSRPFIAWAIGFAKTQVSAWRKRQSRDRLILDDGLFEAVADRLATGSTTTNVRLDALERCLKKLPNVMREMVTARYERGESVQSIAARSGQSVNTVSVSLFRIRQNLLECVRLSLDGEDER